jgi:amino acid transporter
MVSFFSLSLSCLNAGSRIMYPMARHGIFSGHLGRSHATNRTPHVAVTVYIAMIFALPAFLMIFTNPLTAFGDAGTLAAFGFLVAYYLITLAAPMYLKKIGELERKHVVLTVVAVLALLVPTVGSFYPRPAWPVDLFPFIFMAYMAVGAGWLYVVHRRQPGTLAGIQADLARAPELIEEESVEIGEVAPQPVLA